MSTDTGVVAVKIILLISDTLDAGQLTAVKHANGTDCWIVLSEYLSDRYYILLLTLLHVIHYPDEPGLACEVEQYGVSLPYYHLRSMPNFPNYRLGPLVPGAPPAPPCVPVVVR